MALVRFITTAGLALGLSFAPFVADAAITHTTHNLNLRSGPSTHYMVRTVIPAGSSIDILGCGSEWCSVHWAGEAGYVDGHYLVSSVTVEVAPLLTYAAHAHIVV